MSCGNLIRALAIETSCDETAAAVVEWDGERFNIRSNTIVSQAAKHGLFGGVVPELATREHLDALESVVGASMKEACVGWGDLSLVSATRGPGLASALLMGHTFAKTVALARQLPFVGANHMEGHLFSPFLDDAMPSLSGMGEWLSLIVSGGHTLLLAARSDGLYRRLGGTLDDAAGEAFDKGAKLLGLGYPGGPMLEKRARSGRADAYTFPRGMQHSGDLNFSFSGVKTALRVALEKKYGRDQPDGSDLDDLCASYQRAIVDALAIKTRRAVASTGLRRVAVAGGVVANQSLRETLARVGDEDGFEVFFAPTWACTDNAAMIGAVACVQFQRDGASGWDEDVNPNLALGCMGEKISS